MDRGEPKWFAFEIAIFKNQITSLEGAGTAAAPGKGRGAQDTGPRRRWTHVQAPGGQSPSNTLKTTSHLIFTQIIRATARGNKQISRHKSAPVDG